MDCRYIGSFNHYGLFGLVLLSLILGLLRPDGVLAQPAVPTEALPLREADVIPGAEMEPETGAQTGAQTIDLTLPDLLNLTLAGNRELRNRTLERLVQRQQLAEAEQTFDPRFTPILRVDVSQDLTGNGGRGTIVDDPSDGEILLGNDSTDLDQQALLETTLLTRLGTDIRVGVDPLDAQQPFQFRLSQPLLRGFGTAVNEAPVNQARLNENQSQLALRGTTIDTLTTAITQYTGLINAQVQVDIQLSALERRQRQLEILQALVQAGRRAPIELFDTERSVADTQRSLADAQNQLIQANNDLLNLIGTDQNLRFVASAETVDRLFEAALSRAAAYEQAPLVQVALAQRPDYLQAQFQRQQLALDLLVAQDNLRWRLDAVADGNLGDFSQSVVGLVATRTFDEPQLETSRLRSEVSLQQQDNTLAQLQEQIRNDVTASLADVQSNRLGVAAAERATRSARNQLEADQAQFRLGRGNVTLFQIISQEEALVTAQTNELAARIAFLNSLAQLEQTVGITLETWAEQIDLDPLLEDLGPEPQPPS